MLSVSNPSNKKRHRIGNGEFVGPEIFAARQHFLDAVAQICPTALYELEPWSQQLASDPMGQIQARYVGTVQDWVEDHERQLLVEEEDPDSLDSRIRGWLRRYRLDTGPWPAAAILWTLAHWAEAIRTGQRWEIGFAQAPISERGLLFTDKEIAWVSLGADTPAVGEIQLPPEPFPFNLMTEPRESIKDRILKYVGQELERQLAEVERKCETTGMQVASSKNDLKHFQWFARYQVLGEG